MTWLINSLFCFFFKYKQRFTFTRKRRLSRSLTRSFTHSLIHSLIRSLTHSFAHSLIRSLTHSLFYWFFPCPLGIFFLWRFLLCWLHQTFYWVFDKILACVFTNHRFLSAFHICLCISFPSIISVPFCLKNVINVSSDSVRYIQRYGAEERMPICAFPIWRTRDTFGNKCLVARVNMILKQRSFLLRFFFFFVSYMTPFRDN